MKLNESVLKQYVVGFRGAKPAVLWFNIDNYKEVFGENDTKTVSFDEDGITYTYTGSDTKGYEEINNKAPFITGYLLVDEDDLIKRGYLKLFDNVLADAEEDDYEEADDLNYDDPYYDPDAWRRNCGGGSGCGGGYHRHYGCGGGYGGCGGGGGC